MAVLIKNSSDIMGTEHSSNNWIIRVILNRNVALRGQQGRWPSNPKRVTCGPELMKEGKISMPVTKNECEENSPEPVQSWVNHGVPRIR